MAQVLVMVQVMDLLCTCKAILHNPILDLHITTNHHLITVMDMDILMDPDLVCMKRKTGTIEEILMHPQGVLPEVIPT